MPETGTPYTAEEAIGVAIGIREEGIVSDMWDEIAATLDAYASLLSEVEQLTKERDEARAEAHEADDPMAIALVADALNKEQEENHQLRAEVARLQLELNAAHAGGEELNAALALANREVARLRAVIAGVVEIAKPGPGTHVQYARMLHDVNALIVTECPDIALANHPAIAREIGVME